MADPRRNKSADGRATESGPPQQPVPGSGSEQVEEKSPEKLVTVGRITAAHGIRGWIKIHSYTQPEVNVFSYQPWQLQTQGGRQTLKVDRFRGIDKGFLAHLEGVDDREAAGLFTGCEILVDPQVFEPLADGELYWHQLRGLAVISTFAGGRHRLGRVVSLLETGANDVLVVRGDDDSIDRRERLLPYTEKHVTGIDLARGELVTDWDPAF